MSRFPLEGQYNSPRRISRAIAPSKLTTKDGVGYDSANMPLTGQFYAKGEQMAAQLEQALSGLGGAVAHAGAINRRNVDEQNALDEHAQHQRDLIESGQGVNAARTDLAELVDKVQKQDIPAPLNDAAAVQTVDDFIAQKTEGFSEAKKDAYIKSQRHVMDGVLYQYMEGNRAVARKETLDLSNASMSKETTPEGMQGVVDKLRNSGMKLSEDEIYNVVLNTAQTAAVNNDKGKFEAATAVLGGRFPEQMAHAQNTLRIQQDNARSAVDHEFNNLAASMATKEDGAVPYPIQRANLQRFAKEHPEMDATNLRIQLGHIDSAEEQGRRAQAEIDRKTDLAIQMNGRREDIYGHMLNANATGGAATLNDTEVNPPKVTDLRGTEHNVPVKQFIQEAVDRSMRDLNPGVPLTTVTKERVNYLNSNGVIFAPWQAVMRAGANLSPIEALPDPKTGQPNIGINSVAGFGLYRQMMAEDTTGRLASRMLNDRKAELFYETADMARKYNPAGATDAQQTIAALSTATMGMRRTEPLANESKLALATTVKDAMTGTRFLGIGTTGLAEAKNGPEVTGEAMRLAEYLARVGKGPLDGAGARAVEIIKSRYQVVNGWATDMGNNNIPRDPNTKDSLFPGFAQKTIDAYMKSDGDRMGLDKSDLSVVPAGVEGGFMVYNNAMYAPVPNWEQRGFFTTSDIVKDYNAQIGKKSVEAQQERSKAMDSALTPFTPAPITIKPSFRNK